MRVVISVVAAVVGLSALAGCQADGAFPPPGPAPVTEVLSGALKVRAPRGYCVDPEASRAEADSAVVLIGPCSDASGAVPAVLTLTVGTDGSAMVLAEGGEALASYMTSPEGRRALSRRGRAEDVRVIEAFQRGDAFQTHLQDRAVGDYWRAVLGLRGRLVTVSVTPPENAPLSPSAGRALLEAAIAALTRANRG